MSSVNLPVSTTPSKNCSMRLILPTMKNSLHWQATTSTKGTPMNIEDYPDAVKRTCVTTDRDDTITLALPGQERGSILHKLDLGRHTLCLPSYGSIELLANDEQTPSL